VVEDQEVVAGAVAEVVEVVPVEVGKLVRVLVFLDNCSS
jgi:hypothetical protein